MSYRQILVSLSKKYQNKAKSALTSGEYSLKIKKSILNRPITQKSIQSIQKLSQDLDIFRNGKEKDTILPSFKNAVSKFLTRAPLSDSTLIIDGPGIGCGTPLILLGLIGMERLKQLKAVHFFSSSCYGGLNMHARELGEFTLEEKDVPGFYRRNQNRHKVKPFLTGLTFVKSKLSGKQYFFKNDVAEQALASSVSDNYVNRRVKDLPDNFHFWVYDKAARAFVDIHSGDPHYSHWTMGELVRAMVAVPHIYEPLLKDGRVYYDALLAPGIRKHFKELRKESKNVLFWHINVSAYSNDTLFIKGHPGKWGLVRIVSDFVYFICGLENQDVDQAIQLGLFQLKDSPFIEEVKSEEFKSEEVKSVLLPRDQVTLITGRNCHPRRVIFIYFSIA